MTDLIIKYAANENSELKKVSFQMYEDTISDLRNLYKEYPYIRNADILNAIVKEGIKHVKKGEIKHG